MSEDAQPKPAASLQQFAVLYGGLLVVAGVLGFKLIKLGPIFDIGPLAAIPDGSYRAGFRANHLDVADHRAAAAWWQGGWGGTVGSEEEQR
mgnify:CR=1 FL=1